MGDQEQRKNKHVLFDGGNSFYGIDRNDVEIEPEEIGIEESEGNTDNVAQHKKPYQTASLSLNHSWFSCSAHFCWKYEEIFVLNASRENFRAFARMVTLLNVMSLNLSRAALKPTEPGSS